MLEQQALQRVHRLGQTQPVKQIRYIVDGTDSVERVSDDCIFRIVAWANTIRPHVVYTTATTMEAGARRCIP